MIQPLDDLHQYEAALAHRRLSKKMPAREHRIKDEMPALVPPGTKRAVVIAGRTYRSMKAAAKATRMSPNTIYRWLDDGRAAYA